MQEGCVIYMYICIYVYMCACTRLLYLNDLVLTSTLNQDASNISWWFKLLILVLLFFLEKKV